MAQNSAAVEKPQETKKPAVRLREVRKPNLYKILADTLRNWSSEPGDALFQVYKLVQESFIPKGYREMVVIAVLESYCYDEYTSDQHLEEVADTINSMNAGGIVRQIYEQTAEDSAKRIQLKRLSGHIRGW